MAVLYSDRTLPLSANASNTAFSAGVDLAWDFTGVGALANGAPWVYAGATSPTLTINGTLTLTTRVGEPGRVASHLAYYNYTNTTNYGLQTGSGDFTMAVRFTTAATLPSTSNQSTLVKVYGASGTAMEVQLFENPGVGWYVSVNVGAGFDKGTAQTAIFYPVDTKVTFWVTRVSNVYTYYTQNSSAATDVTTRYAASAAASGVLNSSWAASVIINYASTVSGAAVHSVKHWSIGHTAAELSAIGKDYWDAEANTAAIVTDGISISAPATGATVSASSVMSGTYTGAAPTGVQIQIGALGWVTGTAATIGSGAWSATFALPAATASTLQARYSNDTAVLSATIANVTVLPVPTDSITFTAPYPTTSAQSYRCFQRNASNQASVRITGTYVGTPTSLEYSWDGGAYTTLVASPAGGVFDATVTLTGPAQGNLVVRFSNNTAINNTLTAVAVGDVYIVGGQSNHVGGGSGSYVAPVAPSGHTSWIGTMQGKNGVWRPNVETSGQPFADPTGALYAVQSSSGSGSYFGKLATLAMAGGVPVAFVPCAIGSSGIAAWFATLSTSQIYGAMAAMADRVGDHKALLWWQGEYDTTTSAMANSAYQTALNALIDYWYARYARPWVLMNINATGNSVGTSGTGPSDTGFNAIHAAIASVASSNAHVAAIADMNGAFSGSIHYATVPEITEVAARAYAAIASAFYYKHCTLTLTTDGSTPAASQSGISWAWYDSAPPNLTALPANTGTGASTNSSGVFDVVLPSTSLTTGQTGTLLLLVSNGTPGSTANKAFCAPVAVV